MRKTSTTKAAAKTKAAKTAAAAVKTVEKVAEAAGGFTDSGVSGLDAAREYLSQFETLSAEDIVWE